MPWTREAVGALTARKFELNLSFRTVGRCLHKWGFGPQGPMRRAYERNLAQVRYWLRDKYPAIRQRAREEGARISSGDELGLLSDHAVGRTWGPKGQPPAVKATGKRFGCDMISAAANQGNSNFKVLLVVDRHPVHQSRKVEAWLADSKDRIRLFLLPGYSPEFNPDELLNRDLKSNPVGRRRANDKTELIKKVRGYSRSRQRKPDLVARFFQAGQVRYAA
ncbi:MAG: transposase [Desulfovibrionaceae bacterium]|nr:transposase [Desulfovibrionaceae bacterium]